MRLDSITVGGERWMSHGCIEHSLLPIDQQISNAGIDRPVFIERLEMAQKTSSEIAVAWTEL